MFLGRLLKQMACQGRFVSFFTCFWKVGLDLGSSSHEVLMKIKSTKSLWLSFLEIQLQSTLWKWGIFKRGRIATNIASNSRQWKQTRKWTCDLKFPTNNNHRTILFLFWYKQSYVSKKPKTTENKASVIIYRNYSNVSITAYGWNISML